jgi:thioester reductase-like protein
MTPKKKLPDIRIEKNILLTGGTGLVGSNLVSKLLTLGDNINLLVRDINKSIRELPERLKGDLRLLVGDITKPKLGLNTEPKVDEVWHCAASVKFAPKEELALINVQGTKNAVDLARKCNAHLHYVSTSYIAGNFKGRFTEDDFDKGQSFKNAYEESKFEAEELARGADIPVTIYRPSIIVGDSKTGYTTSFQGFYNALKALAYVKEKMGPSRLRLLMNPEGTLNLVCIDYVVSAMTKISEDEQNCGKVYHIVNPNPLTNTKLVEAISSLMDIELEIITEFPSEPTEAEKVYHRLIADYLPYLQGGPDFDYSNTRKVFDNSCPAVDCNVLSNLIEFGRGRNWVA